MIARHTSRYMVKVTPDNILITSGSQQALDFIGRLFVNRGDYIVVEFPLTSAHCRPGMPTARSTLLCP